MSRWGPPTVFDFTSRDFIPLYDIPREEIRGATTSSISRFMTRYVHPPTTRYILVDATVWISRIDNHDALSDVAQNTANAFRLPRDKIRMIMTEADSLIPLDTHIIPIINCHLSATRAFYEFSNYSIQLQAELTTALKDITKEEVKPNELPYPMLRPDRVYVKTYTADERSWNPGRVTSAVTYGSNAGPHRLERDDHDRTKAFLVIEGKMAGIVLRCIPNLRAAASSNTPFSTASMYLLKQAYAYALAFRTQYVALYDYTSLVLIRWNHLDPTHITLHQWTSWNNPTFADHEDRNDCEITVITDRNRMVSALAGFLISALEDCNPDWQP